MLVNIRLILSRLLRRVLLHCSIQDLRTLSLPMTLLLTVATFIYTNLWVSFVMIVGKQPRRYYQIRYMRCGEFFFHAWDLRLISSANNLLTIESIEGSGLWCKFVPWNASKSLRRAIKNWSNHCYSPWAI